jgi:hypothetical protein
MDNYVEKNATIIRVRKKNHNQSLLPVDRKIWAVDGEGRMAIEKRR